MIIDSSALKHVNSDIGLLQKISKMDEVEVVLASKSTVTSKYIDKVLFDLVMMSVDSSIEVSIRNLQPNLLQCSRFDDTASLLQYQTRHAS